MTEVTKNVIEVAKNVCRTKNVTVYPSIQGPHEVAGQTL